MTALANGDVAAAVAAERTAWRLCFRNDSLALVDWRVRTWLIPCVFNAAQRLDASVGLAYDFAKTPEAFLAGAVGLGALAVANPSQLDTQHLTDANLGYTSPLSDAELSAAFRWEEGEWAPILSSGEAVGVPVCQYGQSADHPGWRVRLKLMIVANDAARRSWVAAGKTWHPRVTEIFVGACLRLAVLAVSSPSSDDTVRLQKAGLA